MVDLARWLGQQLDEDERIARAVEDRSAPWDGQWMADGNSAVRTLNGHVLFYRHDERPLKPGLTEHVAVWDPARVLREIDAKRRIMECHEPWVADNGDIICGRCGREHIEGRPGAHFPCQTLRLLALPYAGRDDYREEWAP